jgi:MFS family permease
VFAAGRSVLSETERRHGRFDFAGAISSTLGMTGIVLGLVEAGTKGWSAPVTLGSLLVGAALLALFVRIEATAEEPIIPLRIIADRTRGSANAARGLGYAGMYGMIFFLTQFLQDVQHHSALVTGLGFLPTPTMVFLASQLTSRVLMKRVPTKLLMLTGLATSAFGLALLTQLSVNTPYVQVLPSLILIGTGLGLSFVSLTTAGLAGVAPADAGAASGVINVAQQLGAALGLAVLVTIFDTVATAGRSGLSQAASHASSSGLIHGLDITFGFAAAFGAAAFLVVAALVRTQREEAPVYVPAVELEMEPAA